VSEFSEAMNSESRPQADGQLAFNAIWKLFFMFDLHMTQFLKTSLDKSVEWAEQREAQQSRVMRHLSSVHHTS